MKPIDRFDFEYHPCMRLGYEYLTLEGETVKMMTLHNPGSDYETMADQHGHHRYSRRPSDIGRATGSPVDAPKNLVIYAKYRQQRMTLEKTAACMIQ